MNVKYSPDSPLRKSGGDGVGTFIMTGYYRAKVIPYMVSKSSMMTWFCYFWVMVEVLLLIHLLYWEEELHQSWFQGDM